MHPGRITNALLIALAISFPVVDDAAAQIVIANSSLDSTEMSRTTLRAIFAMRLRKWDDGSRIRVFVLEKDAPLHGEFCKDILQVYPHQLSRTWHRLVFSGTGQAPIIVQSEQEMTRLVASTPGAIGYLRRASDDPEVTQIKVQ